MCPKVYKSKHEHESKIANKEVSQNRRKNNSANEFEDNRTESTTQKKLQNTANDKIQTIQPMKMDDNESSQHLSSVQFKKGKRKGKGKFSTVGSSPAANSVTNMFIQQHMGNYAAARQMAQNRSGTGISYSHTIDLTETARLLSEMQQRINAGYYIPDNQVMSPHAGGLQYLTGNAYKIWETKYDKKGRLKKTQLINKRFYYDVLGIAGNALHHFDGPE
jgi:hypothetical protein